MTARSPFVTAWLLVAILAVACSDSATHFCQDAVYPDEESSRFVLPYLAGEAYTVGQGNCVEPGTGSHAQGLRGEFAYDILMPTGTTLLAARDGAVLFVEEAFAEGDLGDGNTVLIQHEDGSISNYGHLALEESSVEVGKVVRQGQAIGVSGNMGRSSEPHLHFEVLECVGEPVLSDPFPSFNSTCHSIPTTFANTRPHRFGLVEGEEYEAE